jgi:LuxR family transcriptional regulator, quorum-sensing system regulator CciR
MREYIEEAGQADTLDDLIEAFERAVHCLDYQLYSFSCWDARTSASANAARDHRIVAVNYPDRWVNRYRDQDYFTRDPVIRHARSTISPYQWNDLPVHSGREQLVLQEASEAGLNRGLAIPIHEPWGRVFLATLAADGSTSDHDAVDEFAQAKAHAMVVIFHARYSALSGAMRKGPWVDLTPRESECLEWVAQGKSSWDIGQLMAVSEHTVNFHLKNAMRKFDTASRVTAAVRAVSLGLIHLP